MGFRCIECGFRIGNNKPIFVQYSPGNIRLMRCENCKAVADEYIECEIMGLFWKTAFAFLLLDAYRVLLLNQSEEGWGLSLGFSTLVSRYGKVLMDLLFGNFGFLSFLLLVTRYFLEASFGASRYIDVLLAIFISSYFKIFLIVMMVWEFPSSVLFINDIFVLSSNTVALKVITESSIEKCIGACFSAHAVKLFFRGLLDIAYRDH
ncbi:hypothetical protein RHMOL_Rhmol01G0242900 [Rhododendron molle]|uniref:Uncharacterized protein n=1 Tax=Rhododendron molle TaxID=49168 RepID=A0ACC0Q4M6_RHOML|nr:hypothetical protein RHMOL_Rhmol01G0242900 [Rhododendron molle]